MEDFVERVRDPPPELLARAIDWLLDQGLISADSAERAIAERAEPDVPEVAGPLDPRAIAAAVAAGLRELHDERRKQ